MFTSLRLKNVKNFADETLRMGAFTVIVGANASGKSNIRDALRFLHGVGRGYTLAEALGGKYGAGGQVEWEAVRGAPADLIRYGQESMCLGVDMELGECEADVKAALSPGESAVSYSIGLASKLGAFGVAQEELLAYYEMDWHPRLGRPRFDRPMYTSRPKAPDPVAAQDDIRPAPKLPNAEELRRTQGLDRLHATGWMENILFFTAEPEQTGVPT